MEPLPRCFALLARGCAGGRGPGVRVWRDEMLGLFPSGNKTRKLEFLLAAHQHADDRLQQRRLAVAAACTALRTQGADDRVEQTHVHFLEDQRG